MDETAKEETLFDALAKAQGEFPIIPKTKEVEVKSREGKFLYSFLYADFTEIVEAVRPVLAKYGIAFTQTMVHYPELGMGYVTIITKGSQRLETGFTPAILAQNAMMKDVAGMATYAKRISFSAAFGIVSDEDVDAPSQQEEQLKVKPKAPAQPPPKPLNHAPQANGGPSEAQIKRLYTLATNARWDDGVLKGLLQSVYGLKSSKELSSKDYNFLCSMLEEGCSPDQVVAEINKERK